MGSSATQTKVPIFFHKISTGGEKSKKHKVFFEDPVGGHNRIKFDGCPYIIVGRKVYDCQHGVDRHAKEKQRNQQNRVSERQPPIDGYYERNMCYIIIEVYTVKQPFLQVDVDHYMGPKKRLFKQTTKKLNCPATVIIRETLRFPDYKVPHSLSRFWIFEVIFFVR